MGDRAFHTVADLFPLMRGEAFAELVADIKKNGLHEPILVDAEGRIVDGRNRYRACLEARVEPRYVKWSGEGELAELALSLNLRRRHLNESQRAMVAARLAKLLEKPMGRPRKSPANLQDFSPGESRTEAATQVNVSPRLTSYAIRVLQQGCSELIAAVESGALAVSAAAALAGRPGEEQKQVVAGGAKEAARKVRELRGAKTSAPPAPVTGSFGIFRSETANDAVVLLWVDPPALDIAIEALKALGLRLAPSGV